MINLTKQQDRFLPALRWLMREGPRASGRTYLMSIVFIEMAINEGRPIKVYNHHQAINHTGEGIMLKAIEKVWYKTPEWYENYSLKSNLRDGTISVTGKVLEEH